MRSAYLHEDLLLIRRSTFRTIARWENPMNPRWPPTCSSRESRSKIHFRALVYLHSSLLVAGFLFAQGDENLRRRRENMVETQIATPRGSGAERVQDSSVLDSMLQTPPDRLVPAALLPHAYPDPPPSHH